MNVSMSAYLLTEYDRHRDAFIRWTQTRTPRYLPEPLRAEMLMRVLELSLLQIRATQAIAAQRPRRVVLGNFDTRALQRRTANQQELEA